MLQYLSVQCLFYMTGMLFAKHTGLYMNHKCLSSHTSWSRLSLILQTPSVKILSFLLHRFIASLNAVLISSLLDVKMSYRKKRKEKQNWYRSMNVSCWLRAARKGMEKEKQARILQRSRSLASSGFVITIEADTFPLLIWWDEVCSRGGGGETKQKWRKLCLAEWREKYFSLT